MEAEARVWAALAVRPLADIAAWNTAIEKMDVDLEQFIELARSVIAVD